MLDLPPNHWTWNRKTLSRFLRPSFFVFTALELLLGIAAVDGNPSPLMLLLVIGVAVSFHIFAYVQNDVLDLPVDRTQPLRAEDPLVTGLMSPRAAMALALAQVPVTLGLTWLAAGNLAAYITILVSFGCMTVYNLFGKRCGIPMLTDAVQGMSWGSLAIYGSFIAAGSINTLSVVAFTFGFGFIFLINGVHGGLRDVANDKAKGCKTTAIFFGAKPDGQGAESTLALRIFAYIALATHLLPASIALYRGDFGYRATALWLVTVAWVIAVAACFRGLQRVTAKRIENRVRIISNHGIPLLLAPLVMFAPRMSGALIATLFLCYLLPIVALDPPRLVGARWFLDRK